MEGVSSFSKQSCVLCSFSFCKSRQLGTGDVPVSHSAAYCHTLLTLLGGRGGGVEECEYFSFLFPRPAGGGEGEQSKSILGAQCGFFGRFFCNAVKKIIGKICSLLETYLVFSHDINPFPRLKNFEIKVLSSVSGKLPSPPFLSTIRGWVGSNGKGMGMRHAQLNTAPD